MKELSVNAGGVKTQVLVGTRLESLRLHCINAQKVLVVVDFNVAKIYGDKLPDFPKVVLNAIEEEKTLGAVEKIYRACIENRLDRHSLIIGIGGGIIGDIAGFAAATFVRGTRFALVPTTLLSQVDACLGGKTGVNFQGFKNMIGSFKQPEFVLSDQTVLSTLPKKTYCEGLAEVVKHAGIADAGFFEFLEVNHARIIQREQDVLEELVTQSLSIKASVVAKDAFEKYERMKLNFGHTFAHAIEKCSHDYSHGEAVAIGMCLANDFAVERGFLAESEAKKMKQMLSQFNLPTSLEGVKASELFGAVAIDKKKHDEKLRLVLLNKIGSVEIVEVEKKALKKFLEKLGE